MGLARLYNLQRRIHECNELKFQLAMKDT